MATGLSGAAGAGAGPVAPAGGRPGRGGAHRRRGTRRRTVLLAGGAAAALAAAALAVTILRGDGEPSASQRSSTAATLTPGPSAATTPTGPGSPTGATTGPAFVLAAPVAADAEFTDPQGDCPGFGEEFPSDLVFSTTSPGVLRVEGLPGLDDPPASGPIDPEGRFVAARSLNEHDGDTFVGQIVGDGGTAVFTARRTDCTQTYQVTFTFQGSTPAP